MNPDKIPALLDFYGIFLIVCGIVSVIFIGLKAKTALISGGMSGVLAITSGYLLHVNTPGAAIAGIVLSGGLFIVFAWRSTKTLFRIFELIPTKDQELKGKGIAFLIISLMAVISIFVFTQQVVSY